MPADRARALMETAVEFSIILESYNLDEGSDPERFRAALEAAIAMMPENGKAEVLVADVSGSPELAEMLAHDFPQVRRIPGTGLAYDGAKNLAARASSGRYVLFLDGDCLPAPGWHDRILETLRSEDALACGGYTRYEGGFWAAIMSVMDFGFMYPRRRRPLKCYASNNCGFERHLLQQVPCPSGAMRCHCFQHAQILLRRGTPLQMVPDACVLHEMPPMLKERFRQGYDAVAACWVDAELPEARWLRAGLFALPLFYTMKVLLDWKRVAIGYKDLTLRWWQAGLSLPVFVVLRLIDAAGMARALTQGPARTVGLVTR